MLVKEQGEHAGIGGSDEVIYKIEIPANRYDLLCLEGLSVAILVFQSKMQTPVYKALAPSDPKALQRLIIKPETKKIRPYAVCAILRDITFTEDSYASFIDLQDKLHHNLGRKRTLVAIGTHDLDTIQGPFVYDALPPDQIKFQPLNQDREYTAIELMDLYSNHTQLKQYLPIIKDSPVYPIIKDADGVVLSMPPIINGHHSRISVNTKNVFIEITATDHHKANIALDTLVTGFSQYCKNRYTSEICEVSWPDGSKHRTPELPYRKETINAKKLTKYIGINEDAGKVVELLCRMSLSARALGGSSILVKVPPTRHDIIHPVDIYEDAAIAFGYNNIKKTMPNTFTVGKQFPLNKLSSQLTDQIAQAGFTEIISFTLCSREDISTKLNKVIEDIPAVHISNPKTAEFQVARTTLLPGILKAVVGNKSMPLPLKLFEISDVVLLDSTTDTGARNERRLCALYYDKKAGFEIIHGLLDRVMKLLEVPWDKQGGYYLNGIDDPTFFPKRCAEVMLKGTKIGTIGVIHPDVLVSYDIHMPCSAVEINIEPFVHPMK
ncbi:hypothetical protein AAG570_002126 [Ranatra chinensis]|uniref:Phenylalanine--tRNA ligase beta subunit n=1 Tax=Ranatra chinensis TaxID=642074 RepID=A0ABD0YTB9_9HEMI